MDEREDMWMGQSDPDRHAPGMTWHEGALWAQYPLTRETAGRERLAHLYRARARRALLVAVSLAVVLASGVAVLGLADLGAWAALALVLVPLVAYGACHALGRAETLSRRALSLED